MIQYNDNNKSERGDSNVPSNVGTGVCQENQQPQRCCYNLELIFRFWFWLIESPQAACAVRGGGFGPLAYILADSLCRISREDFTHRFPSFLGRRSRRWADAPMPVRFLCRADSGWNVRIYAGYNYIRVFTSIGGFPSDDKCNHEQCYLRRFPKGAAFCRPAIWRFSVARVSLQAYNKNVVLSHI